MIAVGINTDDVLRQSSLSEAETDEESIEEIDLESVSPSFVSENLSI